MRKLADIFDEEKRVVLFEDGEWCIYRRSLDRCYIIHRCASISKAEDSTNNSCHACGEVMPVALKGLYILNEWDR